MAAAADVAVADVAAAADIAAADNKWKIRYNDRLISGCVAEVYDCYLSQPQDIKKSPCKRCKIKKPCPKELYVMKILTRINSQDEVNKLTIELAIELGKKNIMPKVIDQGIYPPHKDDPATFKRYYFVMTKYMADGLSYLTRLMAELYTDTKYIGKLIQKYYKSVFDIYRKLAKNGICSYDVKHKNIVLNYDPKTFEITDIRIIDIDYTYAKITYNPDIKTVSQYFVAMVLMYYVTDCYITDERYQTRNCYRNTIRKINFDYIYDLRFDLIKDCEEYIIGTYIGLFYSYYGIYYDLYNINLLEFDKLENKIESFESVFGNILKEFPFSKWL
jgi:hypothetical protein